MTPFTSAAPTDDANPRAVKGGNKPPIADFFRETNDALPGYLAEDNADIIKRVAELMDAFTRAPAAVTDDDLAGKVSDFIAQVAKCAKQAEAKRVDAKAGPLTAGRLIEGFFQKQVLERLDAIKRPLTDRLTAYERAKAAEERRRREEAEAEARRIAQEAAAEAERAAQAIRDAASLDDAIAAEEAATASRAEALAALKAAEAKAAEMSQVRGDFGSSSSLRTTWKGRRVPGAALDLNCLAEHIGADVIEKAINAHARKHQNTKPIPGVEFYTEETAVVRG